MADRQDFMADRRAGSCHARRPDHPASRRYLMSQRMPASARQVPRHVSTNQRLGLKKPCRKLDRNSLESFQTIDTATLLAEIALTFDAARLL
ncbi:hypothetical protein [Aminobacter aminovorans]|uniref:hypothetical protein n=1 Tax=Aminobacter aminovorans TaxID=83263 RepID=UPI0028605093|nr:hypothetical protein [Aminobacter aminovorans]MDR7224342.1 hypothetical protein [Aminobacter aminovorans]